MNRFSFPLLAAAQKAPPCQLPTPAPTPLAGCGEASLGRGDSHSEHWAASWSAQLKKLQVEHLHLPGEAAAAAGAGTGALVLGFLRACSSED